MMCEKCWGDAYRAAFGGGDQVTEYRRLVQERKDSPCSPKDQAGQWWHDEYKIDMRDPKFHGMQDHKKVGP